MTGAATAGSSLPRSVWAVFAGILANFLIAVPIDQLLHAQGVFPPPGEPMTNMQCAIAFSYRLVAAVVGGYLTARLAPSNPKKHVIILGCIGILLSAAGAIAMWRVGPVWYPLSLVVIALPASLLGWRLNGGERTGG